MGGEGEVCYLRMSSGYQDLGGRCTFWWGSGVGRAQLVNGVLIIMGDLSMWQFG